MSSEFVAGAVTVLESDLISGYFGLFNIWGCVNKSESLNYITCLFFIGWVDG